MQLEQMTDIYQSIDQLCVNPKLVGVVIWILSDHSANSSLISLCPIPVSLHMSSKTDAT